MTARQAFEKWWSVFFPYHNEQLKLFAWEAFRAGVTRAEKEIRNDSQDT